jgi:hypothetical protein
VLNEFYWNAVNKMRLLPAKAQIVEDISHWSPVTNSLGIVQDGWRWMDTAQVPYWRSFWQQRGVPYPGTCFRDFQAGRRYEDVEVLHPFENSPGISRSSPPLRQPEGLPRSIAIHSQAADDDALFRPTARNLSRAILERAGKSRAMAVPLPASQRPASE